jgi:ribonuclease HI
MQATNPHFLLFAAATRRRCQVGRWRFVLKPLGAGRRLVAADLEPYTDRNRLELLAVVRGLEALDQPSTVTLLTRSRYVRRGIRHDLQHWRDAGWRWECFGRQVPIRDLDLWLRLDRALVFHRLECVGWHWQTIRADDRRRRLADWGQEVLAAMTSVGRPALSQSA